MTQSTDPNRPNTFSFEELDQTMVGLCLEALDFVIAKHRGEDDHINLGLSIEASQRLRARLSRAGVIRGLVSTEDTEDMARTVGNAVHVLFGREITADCYSAEPDQTKLQQLRSLVDNIPSDEATIWAEHYNL